MKLLSIKSDNCLLSKNSYNIKLDSAEIGDLVKKSLPTELEDYKDYPVKVVISIEFLGQEGINVSTEGYEVKEETEESEGEADGQ